MALFQGVVEGRLFEVDLAGLPEALLALLLLAEGSWVARQQRESGLWVTRRRMNWVMGSKTTERVCHGWQTNRGSGSWVARRQSEWVMGGKPTEGVSDLGRNSVM